MMMMMLEETGRGRESFPTLLDVGEKIGARWEIYPGCLPKLLHGAGMLVTYSVILLTATQITRLGFFLTAPSGQVGMDTRVPKKGELGSVRLACLSWRRQKFEKKRFLSS